MRAIDHDSATEHGATSKLSTVCHCVSGNVNSATDAQAEYAVVFICVPAARSYAVNMADHDATPRLYGEIKRRADLAGCARTVLENYAVESVLKLPIP